MSDYNYGYAYDFLTDGKDYFVGATADLAIDLRQQKVVSRPYPNTVLLHQDTVKELCQTLAREQKAPHFEDVEYGDYVQFYDGSRVFDGFVVYINYRGKNFDITGGNWDIVYPFLNGTSHIIRAHIPAQDVLTYLLKNI